jgi:hypothetical protein
MQKDIYYERAERHFNHLLTIQPAKNSILAHLELAYDALIQANEGHLIKDVNELYRKVYKSRSLYDCRGELQVLKMRLDMRMQELLV